MYIGGIKVKRESKQRGSAILNILGISAAIMVVGVSLYSSILGGIKGAIEEEVRAEAESLSQNMLEAVKYLLLYEKVVYIDEKGPFDFSGSRRDVIDLWSESFGASANTDINIAKACGGFDGKGIFIGTFKYKGSPVFCPVILRSSQLNNLMLEQVILDNMARLNAATKVREGLYKIEIILYDKSKGYDSFKDPHNKFLSINIGQNILNTQKDKLKSAKVTIEIATDSSGFATTTSERFITLTSEVTFQPHVRAYPFVKSHSFVMYPATPREFALFMLYPSKANGDRTDNWSESLDLPKGSVIEGRVFFNGNIDVPIDDLPTFNELVVITGDFSPALDKVEMAKLKNKFLKGVVTKFSEARFIFSGHCSETDASLLVINSAGYNCNISPGMAYTMDNYLSRVGNVCMSNPITQSDGKVSVNCSSGTADCPLTCPGSGNQATPVSGAFADVTLQGSYALISAPIKKLTISASIKNVYGTILGGYVKAVQPLTIKAPALMKVGDIGIGSDDVLKNLSVKFQQALDGVSSPLLNMSIVKAAD